MYTPKAIAADIARELREHPQRWTQGAAAKKADGKSTYSDDEEAVCWCIWGHIKKRAPRWGIELATTDSFNEAVGGNVTTFNDMPGRTVNEMISLCDQIAA